ncbi:MAG: sigma-70 family RNA polymerase sigma factor [Bacilli bacterium]
MMNYKDYNDYELLYLIQDNNERATELLYEKYRFIVELKAKKKVRYAKGKGLDYNDLVQEGMIGLSEAIRDYRDDRNAKFSTFANLCIERQIGSALLRANRKKHQILNESLSLEDSIFDNDKPLSDYIPDQQEIDPGEYLIDLESGKEIYDKISSLLTPLEQQVFELKVCGFNYQEIGLIINKSYKSVDSALQRIKSKIRKTEIFN